MADQRVRIEFWPERGIGPLWIGGTSVEPGPLVGPELAERLNRWNDAFADEKLPMEGPGDPAWLREGSELLGLVRRRLVGTHEVVVTEPWWG